MIRPTLWLVVLALAAPASAATPAAWKAEAKAAAAACIARSDLRRARVQPAAIRFSDALAVDAMIVTGTWRPKHMKGATASMLCLYNRRDRVAEVAEAPGWTSR